MKFHLELKIEDVATGHIHYNGEAHSFTQGFGFIWAAQCAGGNLGTTTKDIGGTARILGNTIGNFFSEVGVGYGGTLGIVVGRGSEAESIADYKLGTVYLHGTATNQMWYHATGYTEPSIFAGSASFVFNRIVQNRSTVSQSIYEVGMISYGYVASTPYPILTVRDVLGVPVSVAPEEMKLIQYTIGVVP